MKKTLLFLLLALFMFSCSAADAEFEETASAEGTFLKSVMSKQSDDSSTSTFIFDGNGRVLETDIFEGLTGSVRADFYEVKSPTSAIYLIDGYYFGVQYTEYGIQTVVQSPSTSLFFRSASDVDFSEISEKRIDIFEQDEIQETANTNLPASAPNNTLETTPTGYYTNFIVSNLPIEFDNSVAGVIATVSVRIGEEISTYDEDGNLLFTDHLPETASIGNLRLELVLATSVSFGHYGTGEYFLPLGVPSLRTEGSLYLSGSEAIYTGTVGDKTVYFGIKYTAEVTQTYEDDSDTMSDIVREYAPAYIQFANEYAFVENIADVDFGKLSEKLNQ